VKNTLTYSLGASVKKKKKVFFMNLTRTRSFRVFSYSKKLKLTCFLKPAGEFIGGERSKDKKTLRNSSRNSWDLYYKTF